MLSNSSMSATRMSPCQILPRLMHIRGILLAKRSCQIDEALNGLVQKSENIQPLRQYELLDLSMYLRIAYHEEFSHLPRGPGQFADSNGTPWNQPTVFHRSPNATMQLLVLFVPLCQQYHSSQIDGLSKFDDSMIDLHRISNELSVCLTLGFSDGSRNFLKLFSVSWELIVSHGYDLYPLSCKILYHDSVWVMVSKFTFLVEDFVICCYQVTKLLCSRYCFASAPSARSPCHLGSHAYSAISCSQNWWITLEQQEVLSCPCAYSCLSLFGQPWFLTADPLKGKSVFFAELSKW